MVESIYEESCLNKNAVTLIEISLQRTSHGFVLKFLITLVNALVQVSITYLKNKYICLKCYL